MKKKVLLVIFALFSVFGVKAKDSSYKANIIKMDQKSYYKGEFTKGSGKFCGISNPDFLYVTKENKIIFYDEDNYDDDDYVNYKIWDEVNGCQNLTQEEYFEIFEYKSINYSVDCDDEESLDEGQEQKCYVFLEEKYNSPDDSYIIKNYDEYDENRFYWKKNDGSLEWILGNKEEYVKSHINEVYYSSHFKHVTSKNLDSNERYYVLNNNQMEEYTGLLTDITDFNNLYVAIDNEESYPVMEFSAERFFELLELYEEFTTIYMNGKWYINFYDSTTLEAVTFDENFNRVDKLDGIFFQNSSFQLSNGFYSIGMDLNTFVPESLVKSNIYDADFDVIDTISYDGFGGTELLNALDSDGRIYLALYDYIDYEINFKTLVHYDVYKVLDGDNQTITDKDISIRYNASLDKFNHLEINGKKVDEKYYTLKSGSTIVTLDSEFLSTLEKGVNKVSAFFEVGSGDSLIELTTILNKNEEFIPKKEEDKKEDKKEEKKEEESQKEANETADDKKQKNEEKNINNKVKEENVPKTFDSVIKYSLILLISCVGIISSYVFIKKGF